MTIKTLARSLSLGLVLAAVAVSSAQARRHHQERSAPVFDRHAVSGHGPSYASPRTERMKQKRKAKRTASRRHHYHHRTRVAQRGEVKLLPHPKGCPSRAFCGCGVALDVFGKHVRELWLARNWFKFPKATPAPGMVAVRRHHVFAIRKMIRPGVALAYDPNSGGHRTRLHPRSLAGYRIVNPHGRRYASAG